MSFWVFYYHIIWATHERQPLLSPAHEQIIRQVIVNKSYMLSCPLMALNMVADHVHLVVSIPPKIAVNKYIADIKGATSHEINLVLQPDNRFRWQTGYGALTFGERALELVVAYIQNQKQHHADQSVITYLERIE